MSTENETTTSSVPPSPSSPVSAAAYDTVSATAYGPDPADVEKNKIFAILAYLGILFLVPLLAAKESRFAMYHANQGLVLFLFALAVGVVMAVPVLGWIVGVVGWVAEIVFMILGIINAANGQMKPLPLIGGITLLK
jgi:uncharacterized membrane protein